ncbi:MAG: PDGLE domain-containing protein [Endomicrobiales bacterium]|jgi:hypothetical protein
MKTTTKLWIGIGVLIIVSPLGILLPEHFKAGSAWGEWSAGEIEKLIGYVPQGLAKASTIWHAPLAGYAFKGCTQKGIMCHSAGYICSALLGIVIIVIIIIAAGNIFTRNSGDNDVNKKT